MPPVAERFIPVLELLEERIQLSTTVLPNPVVVGDFSLIAGPVAGVAPSTTIDNQPVAYFSDRFLPINTAPELYIAQVDWGDGTSSAGSITAAVAPVTVSIFTGFTPSGAGQPFSNLVGTFSTSDVQFGVGTEFNWQPFELNSFGAEITGNLEVTADGAYEFLLGSEDGSQLFIDGSLVIDNGNLHPFQTLGTTIGLSAGVHSFAIHYFATPAAAAGVDLTLPAGVNFADTYVVNGTHTYEVDDSTFTPTVLLTRVPEIAGPPSVGNGNPYTLDLFYNPLPGESNIQWTIFWGDKEEGEVIEGNPPSITHFYFDDGPNFHTISAQLTSSIFTNPVSAGSFVGVSVADASIFGAASVSAGETYTLFLNFLSFDESEFVESWTINWGDGQVEQVPGSASEVTHVFSGSATPFTVNAIAFTSTGGVVGASPIDVIVPQVTISGASSVQVNQVYTLNLSYTPLRNDREQDEDITSWTINWGDGSPAEVFLGNPSSVTHVYTDAPNAYLITATASTVFSGQPSSVPAQNSLLVNVLTAVVGSSASGVLTGPGTTVVTTPDGTASAVVIRTGNFDTPLVVFLAHYTRDPNLGTDPTLSTIGTTIIVNGPDGQRIELTSYDLRVTGARPGDVVVVSFAIPQPSFFPILRFIDDVTGLSLPIAGSSNPELVKVFGVTPARVNNTFVVVFDFNTSFPTLRQLRGTVFTITDVAGFLPPLNNLFVDGQSSPRNLTASTDILGSLLGGDNADDGGAVLGALSATQVSGVAQGGSGTEPDEEARAQQRDLLRTVDSILEQLQQLFGNQIQLYLESLIVSAVPPPVPVADAEVSDHFALLTDLEDNSFVGDSPLDAAPSPIVDVAVDPFAEADDAPAPWWTLFDSQLLTCVSLAAMPFMPWHEVFGNPDPERRRTPSLR